MKKKRRFHPLPLDQLPPGRWVSIPLIRLDAEGQPVARFSASREREIETAFDRFTAQIIITLRALPHLPSAPLTIPVIAGPSGPLTRGLLPGERAHA